MNTFLKIIAPICLLFILNGCGESDARKIAKIRSKMLHITSSAMNDYARLDASIQSKLGRKTNDVKENLKDLLNQCQLINNRIILRNTESKIVIMETGIYTYDKIGKTYRINKTVSGIQLKEYKSLINFWRDIEKPVVIAEGKLSTLCKKIVNIIAK